MFRQQIIFVFVPLILIFIVNVLTAPINNMGWYTESSDIRSNTTILTNKSTVIFNNSDSESYETIIKPTIDNDNDNDSNSDETFETAMVIETNTTVINEENLVTNDGILVNTTNAFHSNLDFMNIVDFDMLNDHDDVTEPSGVENGRNLQ